MKIETKKMTRDATQRKVMKRREIPTGYGTALERGWKSFERLVEIRHKEWARRKGLVA